MKSRTLLALAILFPAFLLAAEEPRPVEEVDLASLGHNKTCDGSPGVEWDEACDVSRVEIEFASEQQIPSGDNLHVEYWVGTWPPDGNLGPDFAVDSPWQGEWRSITAHRTVERKKLVYRFKPLTAAENPNAPHLIGPPSSFDERSSFACISAAPQTFLVRCMSTELHGETSATSSPRPGAKEKSLPRRGLDLQRGRFWDLIHFLAVLGINQESATPRECV